MREIYLLPTGNPDLTWQDEARCAVEDPVAFFHGSVEKAVAICAQCPVQRECLGYAFENDEQFGIWGGMTAAERATVRDMADPKSTTSSAQILLVCIAIGILGGLFGGDVGGVMVLGAFIIGFVMVLSILWDLATRRGRRSS